MKGDSLDICENDEKNMHVLSEWVLICYYEVIESYFGYCCWRCCLGQQERQGKL